MHRANYRFNLTALKSVDEIETQLVDQSTTLVDYLPKQCQRLLDVGSGGGIPGIPLAICRTYIAIDLVDATAKKVAFLDETVAALGLTNVRTIHGRAEQLGHQPAFREQYDVATARALAALPTLVEYVLPFLRLGGVALLPKGSEPRNEVAAAGEAIEALGGRLQSVIIDPAIGGSLIVVAKSSPTPDRYPRRTGIPSKRPIGVPS